MGRRSSEKGFIQQLVLYAASAALSYLVLVVGLKQLDPNREASKKAVEQKKEIAKRLGRPLIHTNPYEDVIACDVINPAHIDVEFNSIGGLKSIKQAVFELVILPLKRPELFSYGKLLGNPKGVLLYGPPGTGKTMLAKAIAKESGAVFINVRVSNLMSKWFGDAQKLVAAVFSLAYKLQPAIIFIDEVDSFLGQRRSSDHEALTNMKTEFMALWDGFTTDENARVMVLAATNRPSELDEAILRRFSQAFEIGMPDLRDRAEILKVILQGERVEDDIDFDHLASLCDGYTGSDLFDLCKQAAYLPIRELLDAEKSGNPSRRSFLKFHSQVPSHGPCLLTFWKNAQTPQCSVFSLPLKTWYRIPFTFLPVWALCLVGSSSGLVCFSGLDGLTFRTLICNPLTQSWRTLPSMHYNQQRQLIMVVDRKDRSFKVIATSDIYGDKSLPTEVYDSKLNIWSLHQMMPAVNLCSSKMAFCDSRLYLETLSPLGLMMYRLDTGYWEHIPARFPRSLLDGYLVAGTRKRLFLVGRIGLYSTLQSMRIWELDHAKTQWVEISRMPPKYFRALLRLSAERFECFGQDNLICLTSWNQGKGLLYDVDKKVWSWIAGCAWQSYNSQVCFYEPRFDADASVHS